MFGFNNEKKLINRAKEEDREALALLIMKYRGALFGYAIKRMKNEANAKDMVSATVEKILLKISTLKSVNFRSWAFQILENNINDFYKKKANQTDELPINELSFLERFLTNDFDLDLIPDDIYNILRKSGYDISTHAEFDEFIEQHLDDKCYQIIVLFFLKGLSHQEIRENFIEGHKKDRLYRCMKKLKEFFGIKK